MNLKINFHYIYILIFTSFFFLWDVSLNIKIISSSHYLHQINRYFTLNFLIIFLAIPIFLKSIKAKSFSINQIFNHQKYIAFFILFLTTHFFLGKIYYSEIIDKYEIAILLLIVLLSIIYCHYRKFIINNFKKILTFYLIVFVIYSIFEGTQNYNVGQCNNDLFLIDLIRRYLKINLTNSIYIENSHLAMMTIAVFFSSLLVLIQGKRNNILFLLLFLIEVIIVLNNLSTTFFVGYFLSQITLLLFLFKKINIKFWIVSILFLLINSSLFLSDKNCVVKIKDFSSQDIMSENLFKTKNLTTLIYERSIIVTIDTLKHRPFGWGIDGMDDATDNLTGKPKYNDDTPSFLPDENGEYDAINIDAEIKKFHKRGIVLANVVQLNRKDGLSNFFKMFTEFGIFTFIIFFLFLKYLLNTKNINPYNLFIIALFITLCIRGTGYFNGGFIFCILELFYHTKFIDKLKYTEKNYSN